MKGKWSKGIEPRNFCWIIKDSIAICERPGGHTANHRRVRRHEEVIWIREHGFHRVISLIPSPHNLHAYAELNMPFEHVPLGPHDDAHMAMSVLFLNLKIWIARGEKIIIHQDEISDRLQGTMGAYLLYAGLLANGPQAITVIEHVMSRQLGPAGRELINLAELGLEIPPAAPTSNAAEPTSSPGQTVLSTDRQAGSGAPTSHPAPVAP